MKKVCVIFSLIFLLISCGEEKINHNTDWENFPSMDFEKSMRTFEESDKPVLVLFNAIGCLNCRRFERVLKREVGLEKIKSKYNLINLYLDDKTKLSESECFEHRGRTIKRRGQVNVIIQTEKLQTGSQPYLAVMNKEGEIIKQKSGFKYNIKEFLEIED
jgi:thioredoxin-related protein